MTLMRMTRIACTKPEKKWRIPLITAPNLPQKTGGLFDKGLAVADDNGDVPDAMPANIIYELDMANICFDFEDAQLKTKTIAHDHVYLNEMASSSALSGSSGDANMKSKFQDEETPDELEHMDDLSCERQTNILPSLAGVSSHRGINPDSVQQQPDTNMTRQPCGDGKPIDVDIIDVRDFLTDKTSTDRRLSRANMKQDDPIGYRQRGDKNNAASRLSRLRRKQKDSEEGKLVRKLEHKNCSLRKEMSELKKERILLKGILFGKTQ